MEHYSKSREIAERERVILRKLLRHDFIGASQLRRQIDGILVSDIPGESSLVLFPRVESGSSASVEYQQPVEGKGLDSDGVPIHFVVHVVNGWLSELEIFREDSKPLIRWPDAESIQVY
jgi:hypothetical protein